LHGVLIGFILASVAFGQQVSAIATSFGCVADEQIITNAAISLSGTALTSASNPFTAANVGKVVWINGAGVGGVDLATTITGYTSAGHVTVGTAASTAVTSGVAVWGTDNTPCLITNALPAMTSGGTLTFGTGRYLFSGQILIPNNGSASFPTQPSIRITGTGGYGVINNAGPDTTGGGGTVLDLRYAGGSLTSAKIETRASGLLELDHMTLIDTGTDTTPFGHTTNTRLLIHDNVIICDQQGQHGFIFGGTTMTVTGVGATNAFQGYGTIVHHNFFDGCSALGYFRAFANSIQFTENTAYINSMGIAPIVMDGGGVETSEGNYVAGNYYELEGYTYAYYLSNSIRNVFLGDQVWDPGNSFTAWIYGGTQSLVEPAETANHLTIPIAAGSAQGIWIDNNGPRNFGGLPQCVYAVQLGTLATSAGGTTDVVYSCTQSGSGYAYMPLTEAVAYPIALTGQTSSISSTNIVTPGTGMFRVCGVITVSSAGTAGTVSLGLTWRDEGGSESATLISSLALTSLAPLATAGSCQILTSTSAAIAYSTTVTGALGSPTYSLRISTEVLGVQ
jgi:hypothetical protein